MASKPESTINVKFPKFRKFLILILFVLPVFLIMISGAANLFTNNAPSTKFTSWNSALLRTIDPVDSENTSTDILAVFSNWEQKNLLLRIDFLKLPDTTQTISLSFASKKSLGEIKPEVSNIFDFSLENLPKEFNIKNGNKANIELYTMGSDWFSLRVSGLTRTEYPFLQISFFSHNTLEDETGWFDLRQAMKPAYLFIAFYNTLNASTPAQALRQWDGAHSGPIGSRHGLRYLLENVNVYNVPVTLLDINRKESLHLLALLDEAELFIQLVQERLVIAPEVTYGEPRVQSEITLLNNLNSRQTAIPANTSLFGPLSTSIPGYDTYFYATQENTDYIYSSLEYRLLPIAKEEQRYLINEKGFTSAFITELANTGSNLNSSEIVILGGDFSNSFWGDPNSSYKALSYLADHPWIKTLTPQEMHQLPAQPVSSFVNKCTNLLCISDDLYRNITDEEAAQRVNGYAQLKKLPLNNVSQSAWNLYAELTSLTTNIDLVRLKRSYYSTFDMLLSASQWSANPVEIQSCGQFPNLPYCVLSNEKLLAILSTMDGSLVMLFSSHNGTITQWVAPYSQYVIGLSDPADWQQDMNTILDPALIEGAFREKDTSEAFTLQTTPQVFTFSSKEGVISKTYTLTDTSLSINIQSDKFESYSIPILGNIVQTLHINAIQIHSDSVKSNAGFIKLEFEGISNIESLSYTDSSEYLKLPEDPNKLYSRGHYLPIPFSIIEFDAQKQFTILFTFIE